MSLLQEQVFGNPDVVERLLIFLDANSTLRLAQSRISCTLHVLEHTSTAWNKLVKRTAGRFELLAGFDEKRALIEPLVDILKMLDDPNSHALDLLEVICEKYPSAGPLYYIRNPMYHIEISCPRHTTHFVSSEGFQLLEEVEGALGSALQEIISIEAVRHLRGPLLAAFASRASRQQGKITKVSLRFADCTTRRSAEDLSTLLHKCEAGGVERMLVIDGNIEEEGWAALGKAFSSVLVRLNVVQVLERKFMTEGRREDIRSVWESVARCWILASEVGFEGRLLPKSEKGWKELEDILDGSKEEETGVEQSE